MIFMHINPKKKKKLNHDNKTLPLDYMFDIQIRQMILQCHTKQIEIQQMNQGKKKTFNHIVFVFQQTRFYRKMFFFLNKPFSTLKENHNLIYYKINHL